MSEDVRGESEGGGEIEGESQDESQDKCRKTRKYNRVCFVIILYYKKNFDIL